MPPSEEYNVERGGPRETLSCGYPTDTTLAHGQWDRGGLHQKYGPRLNHGEMALCLCDLLQNQPQSNKEKEKSQLRSKKCSPKLSRSSKPSLRCRTQFGGDRAHGSKSDIVAQCGNLAGILEERREAR